MAQRLCRVAARFCNLGLALQHLHMRSAEASAREKRITNMLTIISDISVSIR